MTGWSSHGRLQTTFRPRPPPRAWVRPLRGRARRPQGPPARRPPAPPAWRPRGRPRAACERQPPRDLQAWPRLRRPPERACARPRVRPRRRPARVAHRLLGARPPAPPPWRPLRRPRQACRVLRPAGRREEKPQDPQEESCAALRWALLALALLLLAGCGQPPPVPQGIPVDTHGRALPTLHGVVVDEAVHPLPGVIVRFLGTDVNVTTDQDGAYEFHEQIGR